MSDRLIELIRAKSFSTGADIKLASGRVSNYYFNMKPSMMDPEGAALIAGAMLDRLAGAGITHAGGLAMGAVPLAAALAVMSHVRGVPVKTFFIRKAAKQHGTRSLIEGLAPGDTLQDARVAVLEDVTTTGGSALQAVDQVRAAGGNVVRVISVVDRLEGAGDAFAAAGIEFTALLTRDDFV